MSYRVFRCRGPYPAATAIAVTISVALSWPANAQTASASSLTDKSPAALQDVITVEGARATAAPPVAERFALPQTFESITAEEIEQTVNLLDTEDAVKYMPSLFIRKRNYGDTQPVMATRTWGVNSSARSLVYDDDVLLTALVANNNSIGAPRWGLISPEEIERIDVMYGPFAAQYAGNSMGAVMQITTRMPTDFEASGKQIEAFQSFHVYGTTDTYRTDESTGSVGARVGDFSFWISGEHTNSYAQPLSFATFSGVPAGTSGIYFAQNKLGQTANVAGATALLHTDMNNAKLKLVYDLPDDVRATYIFGLWTNDGDSKVRSYLKDASGNATYGGVSGFASGYYNIQELHTMHSLAVKSDTREAWDWEAVATHFSFDTDDQASPQGVTTGTNFTTAGRLASYAGTNWSTLDAKGIWRPYGKAGLAETGATEFSFGAHADWYNLNNPTYNIASWSDGYGAIRTGLATKGLGATRTFAIWAQDAWKFAPDLTATIGGRAEWWRAYDGYNYQSSGAAGVAVSQPQISKNAFSPKATLAWDMAPEWTLKGSFGQAYRFPTVAELYQLVSTGTTFTSPNPNLAPETAYSEEAALEWKHADFSGRVSLFWENVTDALIAQTSSLAQGNGNIANVSFVQNVGEIQNRGVELAFERKNILFDGFDISGSVTYVDSRILRDANARSSLNTALAVNVVGKHVPNVPDWRATLVGTYRPDEQWSLTLAARYSGQIYSTVDNADRVANVYQSFNPYFVADARVHYAFDERFSGSVGIDNLTDSNYWEFHPFPQRTVVAELKIKL